MFDRIILVCALEVNARPMNHFFRLMEDEGHFATADNHAALLGGSSLATKWQSFEEFWEEMVQREISPNEWCYTQYVRGLAYKHSKSESTLQRIQDVITEQQTKGVPVSIGEWEALAHRGKN